MIFKQAEGLVKLCSLVISFILVLFLLVINFIPATAYGVTIGDEPSEYSSDDTHALIMPTVARVINYTKGEISAQMFTFDIDTFEVTSHPVDKEVHKETLEFTFTGTAFSIDESGLFVTNAHVATPDLIRLQMLQYMMMGVMMEQIQDLARRYGYDSEQVKEYEKRLEDITKLESNDPSLVQFRDKLLNYITYTEEDFRTAVVPQNTDMTTFDDLKDVGFETTRKFVFPKWLTNNKDVAILRVEDDEAKLPAVTIESADYKTPINSEISVYGYPGSTDISYRTFTNTTVTTGRVTSIKKEGDNSAEAIQIDAKISEGSSGGPLVNSEGKVIGIVTAETGSESGDNFGFAVPISLIHELLDENALDITSTKYSDAVRKGLAYKEHKRCAKAIEQFESATALNASWDFIESETEGLIEECEEMIENGESIDTFIDELFEYFSNASPMIWMLVIGGVIFVMFGIILILFSKLKKRRMKQQINEQDINSATIYPSGGGTPTGGNFMRQSPPQQQSYNQNQVSGMQNNQPQGGQQPLGAKIANRAPLYSNNPQATPTTPQAQQSSNVPKSNVGSQQSSQGWYINKKPVAPQGAQSVTPTPTVSAPKQPTPQTPPTQQPQSVPTPPPSQSKPPLAQQATPTQQTAPQGTAPQPQRQTAQRPTPSIPQQQPQQTTQRQASPAPKVPTQNTQPAAQQSAPPMRPTPTSAPTPQPTTPQSQTPPAQQSAVNAPNNVGGTDKKFSFPRSQANTSTDENLS